MQDFIGSLSILKQMTFAAAKGFEVHGRTTRKAQFLARMEALIPWREFCALIEPHYPKEGKGRPPKGLERMLRMYLVANWFNLADEACKEALYDAPALGQPAHRRGASGVREMRKKTPN
jgi:IS5 family transposase